MFFVFIIAYYPQMFYRLLVYFFREMYEQNGGRLQAISGSHSLPARSNPSPNFI